MACQFCATGQSGFQRQLTQGEIVEQVAAAMRKSGSRRVSNIVFMGMGEPLANYDRVWGAVVRLHGDMGLSARHLTLSTVGIVPGIRRLATETLPVNLAVSLHAANDVLRDELVPINRRYPLGMLAEACADYVKASGRRLSIEWAMIDNVNDRRSDAAELAEFARPLKRPRPASSAQPDARATRVVGSSRSGCVRRFRDQLVALGGERLPSAVAQAQEIDAACERLAGLHPGRVTEGRCRRPTRSGCSAARDLAEAAYACVQEQSGRRPSVVVLVSAARRRHHRPDEIGGEQDRRDQGGRDDR